jgi:phage shock protein PspC (stress-responsive transcriptional regulator)
MSEKRLMRSTSDRMLFGVAAGLANYFNVDPILIRLLFIILTVTQGYGLLIYVILALLMPEDKPVAKANAFDDEEIVIKNAS